MSGSLELVAKRRNDSLRKHRDAVLAALPVANENLATHDIDVLNAQSSRFHDSQSSAIKQFAEQAMRTPERSEKPHDLAAREHNGHTHGRLGADDVVEPGKIAGEHLAIQKQQRALRLVLGGCGDVAFGGEMGQKGFDVGGA